MNAAEVHQKDGFGQCETYRLLDSSKGKGPENLECDCGARYLASQVVFELASKRATKKQGARTDSESRSFPSFEEFYQISSNLPRNMKVETDIKNPKDVRLVWGNDQINESLTSFEVYLCIGKDIRGVKDFDPSPQLSKPMVASSSQDQPIPSRSPSPLRSPPDENSDPEHAVLLRKFKTTQRHVDINNLEPGQWYTVQMRCDNPNIPVPNSVPFTFSTPYPSVTNLYYQWLSKGQLEVSCSASPNAENYKFRFHFEDESELSFTTLLPNYTLNLDPQKSLLRVEIIAFSEHGVPSSEPTSLMITAFGSLPAELDRSIPVSPNWSDAGLPLLVHESDSDSKAPSEHRDKSDVESTIEMIEESNGETDGEINGYNNVESDTDVNTNDYKDDADLEFESDEDDPEWVTEPIRKSSARTFKLRDALEIDEQIVHVNDVVEVIAVVNRDDSSRQISSRLILRIEDIRVSNPGPGNKYRSFLEVLEYRRFTDYESGFNGRDDDTPSPTTGDVFLECDSKSRILEFVKNGEIERGKIKSGSIESREIASDQILQVVAHRRITYPGQNSEYASLCCTHVRVISKDNHRTETFIRIRPHRSEASPIDQPLLNKLSVGDFFSGAGGASAGFSAAGFPITLGIDRSPEAALAWKLNHPQAEEHTATIHSYLEGRQNGHLRGKPGDPAIALVCPPCEGFSTANSGGKNDELSRSFLSSVLDIARDIEPFYIVMENVSGLAMPKNRHYLRRVTVGLLDLGYTLWSSLLDASDFGVPQKRRRLVLLAARQGLNLPGIPLATHGPDGEEDFVTLRMAIEDLNIENPRKDDENANPKFIFKPSTRGPTSSFIKRLRSRSRPGNDTRSSQYLSHHSTSAHSEVKLVGKRADWESPSQTVLTTLSERWRCVHPDRHRNFTVREVARIQSFPDDWQFSGKLRSQYKQVGNALPPFLAYAVAMSIRNSLLKDFPRLEAGLNEPRWGVRRDSSDVISTDSEDERSSSGVSDSESDTNIEDFRCRKQTTLGKRKSTVFVELVLFSKRARVLK